MKTISVQKVFSFIGLVTIIVLGWIWFYKTQIDISNQQPVVINTINKINPVATPTISYTLSPKEKDDLTKRNLEKSLNQLNLFLLYNTVRY